MANTVAVRLQPKKTLATLGKAVECASILKGTRGEACDMVESILNCADPANCSLETAGEK